MDPIDRQALINELNNSHYPGAPYIDAGISIAIGKVCEAPTIEPEIMPDGTLYITVNADVANIDRILLSQAGTHLGDLYYKDNEKPERRTGQWIPSICHADGMHHEWCGFHCSLCKKATMLRHNYCPQCGAKMERSEQDETD